MSEVHLVEQGNIAEAHDMAKAKEVGETLNKHYPNYFWMVAFQGSALIVKLAGVELLTHNFEGAGDDPYKWNRHGFIIKHHDSFSASDLAKQAVTAGGELLERAGLKRGKWDGNFAQ